MVGLNPDENVYNLMKKPTPHAYEETLTDFDKGLIGPDVRLTVPLRSRARIKTVASMLRVLAQNLEVVATDPTMNDRIALMTAGGIARATQKSLLEACGLVKIKQKRPVARSMVKAESTDK
jgi:hypothetical protein